MKTRNFTERLAPYKIRTAPGCKQGGHTYYWIGCRYCQENKLQELEAKLRELEVRASGPGRQR